MLIEDLRIAYYCFERKDSTALALRYGGVTNEYYSGFDNDLPDMEIRKRVDEKLSNLHSTLEEDAGKELEKAKSFELPEEIVEEVKNEWPSEDEILISLGSDSEENPANVIEEKRVKTPEEIIDALKELPICVEKTDFYLITGFKQDIGDECFLIYKKGEDFFEINHDEKVELETSLNGWDEVSEWVNSHFPKRCSFISLPKSRIPSSGVLQH